MKLKYCKECDSHKPVFEFHKKTKSKDGLAYNCKDCVREYDRLEYLGVRRLKPIIWTDTHRQCRDCEKLLPLEQFKINKSRSSYCVECRNERKLTQILQKMNLSRERYDQMVIDSNGICCICKRPEIAGRRLAIDHDHNCCPSGRSCGKCIRGLICLKCNNSLGAVNDDPTILLNMVSYLQSYNYRLI